MDVTLAGGFKIFNRSFSKRLNL